MFNHGRDVIEDFTEADMIQLAASLGVSGFGDLIGRARNVSDDDVLIAFGNGNSLQLEDVRISSLDTEDFVFL